MKIDRRSFLSFVVGGAAGTALSPLPYKLTDDLSIWTQNWPWTPVPADGAASFADSTCTLCPGGCGITVRKIDDRAVKIEGMKGHPVNNGGLCLLGLSGLQFLYGPSRIKTPLKRTGKRGAGRWEPVSWQDAVSMLVAKLGKLRADQKSHAVGCLLDADRGTVPYLFARFLTAYGSPNFFRAPSALDTYELMLHLMQGTQSSAGFDFENSDFILSFGCGLIEGWGSPVHMFTANSHWQEKKSRVVQIEPRLSNTAAKATRWVPINPGTEAALAMGLAHVIVRESLYHREFVDNHSFGFLDWTDGGGTSHKGFKRLLLEEYGPDKVAAITGIDKNAIFRLAAEFARAKRPIAVCGRGQGDQPGAIGEFMAVQALNALVGNINRPGGFWTLPEPEYIDWPELEMDGIAAAGMQRERSDGAGNANYPYTRYRVNQLIDTIAGGKQPLEILMVSGANPLYTLPDTRTVRKAFEKIPFVVSFSSYMDETAAFSDLILPNHTYLERYQDVPAPAGFPRPYIGLSRPVVAPQFQTRHVGDVIIKIAKTLGGSVARAFPWSNYEDCLKLTLKDKWQPLSQKGYWTDAAFTPPPWQRAFETTSAKFEFYATALGEGSAEEKHALPHFEPIAPEGDPASYPLVLLPYDSMRLANDGIGNPPFVTKTVADSVLKKNDLLIEINPATAKKLGLSEGRAAKLSTPRGSATVRVHLYDGIMPGVLAMPKGLGHSAGDKYIAGKGINFNQITGPVQDPVSGLNAAWGIRAALGRV